MRKINDKFRYYIFGALSVLAFLFILGSFFLTIDNNSKADTPLKDFPQGYRIISPGIPEALEFAGERIPTENFDISERIEREFLSSTYWHTATVLAIKRASRWFPVIEPLLKKNNIPDDFKYLCVAESNLENVTSPAGAVGFWQFVEETGKKYGLEINDLIDERYHVEKSTEAACRFLSESYSMFGSWISAAASYNMGQTGMSLQLERQKTRNYFNLVLNSETSRYISRLVALKYILSEPSKYGFDVKEDELYKPLEYSEISLNTGVMDFVDFASRRGINYYTLKLYNPWLRDNYLINKKQKKYLIKIPEPATIEVVKEQ
ncbi:MAG TPA: lytic transglycosylase domain-containing protein [Ignavibacteriaceae bacterium]|nr:lytic transglycosylase domain-containing protein [Ignavibacteriaceae bacterium]